MPTENPTFVYILSPVRKVTDDQSVIIKRHVESVKSRGEIVFNPVDDAPQEDKTGYNIVMRELNFLNKMSSENNRVDILWNLGGKPSEGSRVDVGMAYALELRMNLVTVFNKEEPTGPKLAFKTIKEITGEFKLETPHQDRMNNILVEFSRKNGTTIDWDIEMTSEDQEWQRINLGLALGHLAKNPEFKIRMGELRGEDPVNEKSYPKVIKEIERRQNNLTGES